jgi:hypothetical protein
VTRCCMAVIDHLVITVPDLAMGLDWFESAVGVRPAIGGSHPGMGTHNALASMGDSYIELIAPDPDQPDHDGPRPFGVSPDCEPGLVTFAVRPDQGETIESIAAAMRSAGHDPGEVIGMSRTTTDGRTLQWRLTFPAMSANGFIPFLIDWGDTAHPSASAPGDIQLVEFGGSTAENTAANRVLTAIGLGDLAVHGTGGLGALLTGPGQRTWSL